MKHYTYRSVTCRGKRDGRDWKWTFWPFTQAKLRDPKPDQEMPANFEVELIQAAQNDINLEAAKWQKVDLKLKPAYCAALKELESTEAQHNSETHEAEEAKNEFSAIKKKYEDLSAAPLSKKWKIFWLILIGILEFPLNSKVFAVMGDNQLGTYLIAAGMCITIPLLAHFWGEAMRQEKWQGVELGKLIGIPTAMLLILLALSFVRAKYFEAMNAQDLIGISITPLQMTALFIIINIGLFMAAALISYEACPPERKIYDAISKQYRLALRQYEKETSEATASRTSLSKCEQNYQRIRQVRQARHQQSVQELKTISASCEWYLRAYRAANQRQRPDIPPCFRTAPQVPIIPQEMMILNWECSDPDVKEGV